MKLAQFQSSDWNLGGVVISGASWYDSSSISLNCLDSSRQTICTKIICEIHLHKDRKTRIGIDLHFRLRAQTSAKVVGFPQFNEIDVGRYTFNPIIFIKMVDFSEFAQLSVIRLKPWIYTSSRLGRSGHLKGTISTIWNITLQRSLYPCPRLSWGNAHYSKVLHNWAKMESHWFLPFLWMPVLHLLLNRADHICTNMIRSMFQNSNSSRSSKRVRISIKRMQKCAKER